MLFEFFFLILFCLVFNIFVLGGYFLVGAYFYIYRNLVVFWRSFQYPFFCFIFTA